MLSGNFYMVLALAKAFALNAVSFDLNALWYGSVWFDLNLGDDI